MQLLIRQLSTHRECQWLPPIMAFGIVPKGGRQSQFNFTLTDSYNGTHE